MQYHPKLKIAIEEIKEILRKHDIGGIAVVHTPGFAEYLMSIQPSYSCMKVDGDHVRVLAKRADFPNKEAWEKKVSDTSDMLHGLSTCFGNQILGLMELSDRLDETVNAEHKGGAHSSHTTQNQ